MGRPRSKPLEVSRPTNPPTRRLTGVGIATRERILDAAEQLFAERGFIATVVRDITRSANCDLGSITYHFSDKSAILDATLLRRAEETSTALSSALKIAIATHEEQLTVEHVLDAFADTVFRPLSSGEIGWTHYFRLVIRLTAENNEPHPVLAEFYIPVINQYKKTLARLLPRTDVAWGFLMFQAALGMILFEAGSSNRLPTRHALKRMRAKLIPYSAGGFQRLYELHLKS